MKNQQDSIGINIALIKLSSYELICTEKMPHMFQQYQPAYFKPQIKNLLGKEKSV
jgi:hypothetical protein